LERLVKAVLSKTSASVRLPLTNSVSAGVSGTAGTSNAETAGASGDGAAAAAGTDAAVDGASPAARPRNRSGEVGSKSFSVSSWERLRV
jgi:hypothetical protein